MPIGKKYVHPTNAVYNFEWGMELDNFGRISANNTTHSGTTTTHGTYYYDVLGNLLMKGVGSTGNPSDPHLDYHTYQNDIRDQLVHHVSKHFRFGLKHDENGTITDQYWSSSHFDDSAFIYSNESLRLLLR